MPKANITGRAALPREVACKINHARGIGSEQYGWQKERGPERDRKRMVETGAAQLKGVRIPS